MSIYLIAMPIIAGLCLAAGIFIGRSYTQIQQDAEELEKLTKDYDPIMKEIYQGLESMRKAGLV